MARMEANALKSLFGESKILSGSSEIKVKSLSEGCVTLLLCQDEVSAKDKEFIISILKACGIADNYDVLPFDSQIYKNIVNGSPALRQIFLFGFSFRDLGINMGQQQIDFLELDNRYIFTLPPVHIISEDARMKNYLWQKVLKPIYQK